MKSLEQMCAILNRLLDTDEAGFHEMLGFECKCSTGAWPRLLADPDIIVHLDEATGVTMTPLSLINSLVSDQREDGEYAIYRDIDHGRTTCFFVAKRRTA